MALKLYFHPLSSFCQKALVALYENATPFEGVIVDLFDEKSAAEFKKIWPVGKFPVLRDEARECIVPESSIIIEYLARHYPGKVKLISEDEDLARQTRLKDRFFDLYLQVPMQKVIGDRMRPDGKHDPFGVDEARRMLGVALSMLDKDIADKKWAMGDWFSMADCAAAPALFYVNMITPIAGAYPNAARYLDRLKARPSYARALREAEPYFNLVPKEG
ncbi:MAG TPA: glutathione S-transferase family protein [Parvularculaceae bacterium]|nr:glutathione S-transferase family protein [Parvularculaceae bacterium]